jgi:hypothetical protein
MTSARICVVLIDLGVCCFIPAAARTMSHGVQGVSLNVCLCILRVCDSCEQGVGKASRRERPKQKQDLRFHCCEQPWITGELIPHLHLRRSLLAIFCYRMALRFGNSMLGSDTSIIAILGFQGVVASPCLPQNQSWKSSSAFTTSGLHCALTGLSSGMRRFLRQPVRMTPSWIGSTGRRCSERGGKRKNMFSGGNSGRECMLCHNGGTS